MGSWGQFDGNYEFWDRMLTVDWTNFNNPYPLINENFTLVAKYYTTVNLPSKIHYSLGLSSVS